MKEVYFLASIGCIRFYAKIAPLYGRVAQNGKKGSKMEVAALNALDESNSSAFQALKLLLGTLLADEYKLWTSMSASDEASMPLSER